MSDSTILPGEPTPLDARVLGTWRTASVLGSLVVVPIAGAVARWAGIGWGWSAAIGLAAAIVLAALECWRDGLRYRRWRWHVDEMAVVLQHGGLVRHVTTIPRFRLQHVDLSRGPLESRAGLATLTLHVAGSGEHEIPGLPVATAEAVRDALVRSLHVQWLHEQRERVADDGAPDATPPHHSAPHATIPHGADARTAIAHDVARHGTAPHPDARADARDDAA
ncbi:MAG: PH domain-containing protein [Gemmatimonadaceae bacterium]|nr:PH domain-containing protein [Gemmatimonadaceae bacterium]